MELIKIFRLVCALKRQGGGAKMAQSVSLCARVEKSRAFMRARHAVTGKTPDGDGCVPEQVKRMLNTGLGFGPGLDIRHSTMPVATTQATQAPAHPPVGKATLAFQPGEADFQRELKIPTKDGQAASVTFPHILEPNAKESSLQEYLAATESLASQPSVKKTQQADQSEFRSLLTANGGAIHFRNTPLRTAQDFSAFMHTLAKGTGWTPHVDKGLMVLRRPHADNVATANEGPPHQEIGSHNEYGLSSHYPSFIAFFCLSAPDKGGQTPLASSLRLYDRFTREASEYAEAVQKRGIAFAIHHPRGNVEGHIGGNSVFNVSSFGSEGDISSLSEEKKRAIVEENVRALAREGGWDETDQESLPEWKKAGFDGHWLPDGSFVVVQRTPGVRIHPEFGVPTYFTNVHTRFVYAGVDKTRKLDSAWSKSLRTWVAEQQEHQTTEAPAQLPPYIVGDVNADGKRDDFPFPQEWIDQNLRITAEEQVDVEWKVGDVLLIDNLAVQHGRRPWEGDRRLLASLWDFAPTQQASRV